MILTQYINYDIIQSDDSGRLTAINNQEVTGTLSYDSRGRLYSIYFYGGGGAEFYSHKFNYDNFGNRTEKRSYSSGGLLEKYIWTRGRFLSSIEANTYTIGSYEYNVDGVRYSKTVNGVTTTFYYNGNTLMGEDKSNGKKLRYCYDKEGICGFRYNNGSGWKSYTYVKNPQGDIILIKDDMGAPKVKYEYDPWGNVTYKALNLDGGAANPEEVELAKINPFRYRGYYYDEESKLYYLITRYYDPWIGHFISPDSFDYLQPKTIGGINLYAYCNYNPIMYYDPTGKIAVAIALVIALSVTLFTAIGGTVLQVQTSLLSYLGIAIVSIWDPVVRKDMNEIGWNPFNSDEQKVLKSKKVSFYKGAPVIRGEYPDDRSFSVLAIFLDKDEYKTDTVRHEWGHIAQQMMMGIGTYGITVGIPSPPKLGPWDEKGLYYSAPWETLPDLLGGVQSRTHSSTEITRAWLYYAVSICCPPAAYFFLLWE